MTGRLVRGSLRQGLLVCLVVGLLSGLGWATLRALPVLAGGEPATVTEGCVRSVPEPRSTRPVPICFTLFRPAGAGAEAPVPLVLQAPQWAVPRLRDPGAVRAFTDAGFGVLSFDHRGFGDSGGTTHLVDPAYEGRDLAALVAHVAGLPWVEQDGPGDPRMGAIGTSYGGTVQWLAAGLRSADGRPVLDALVPRETWYDAADALAPDGVVRAAWVAGLVDGARPSHALAPALADALAGGVATGAWPDDGAVDLAALLSSRAPAGADARVDVPVLIGQGTSDSLFGPEQAMSTWQHALTPRARARSIFVGYEGGHALPSSGRPGGVLADPCSGALAGGGFTELAVRFLREQLLGEDTGLSGYGELHLATPVGACLTADSPEPTAVRRVGRVSDAGAGRDAVAYEVLDGPVSLAGAPTVTARVVAPGGGTAYYGLAVGPTPDQARLVEELLLPVRVTPAGSGQRRTFPLPGVAVDVPPGSRLWLFAASRSDVFGGRAAGGPVVLERARVALPVVGR